MIKLAGAVSLSFRFPAPLSTAYAYYSDLATILPYLPFIDVVAHYSDDQFRLCYRSTEFGGYAMEIVCDIQALSEGGRHMIHIVPRENLPPVKAKAGVNSSRARGYFTSRGLFFDEGDKTRIEYEFELSSRLPRPVGMRLMPGRVVNGIAANVATARMREVAQGFIQRSIAEFPTWLSLHEATLDAIG